MARTVAIGTQDFAKIRQGNFFYVDKTEFIKQWWENGDDVTLINRPRRFGKTLNMSMMDYFFSVQHAEEKEIFEGLNIFEHEKYRQLQGTYPVIFISFAKVKNGDFGDMLYKISGIIFEEYGKHRYLLEGDLLSDEEKEYFRSIKPKMDGMTALHLAMSLIFIIHGRLQIPLGTDNTRHTG
jgi:hypothetical protein